MSDMIERSNCHFEVQQNANGNYVLVVQFYQESISNLKSSVVGFDLLGGMRLEAAKRLADSLNEHVLDMFISKK